MISTMFGLRAVRFCAQSGAAAAALASSARRDRLWLLILQPFVDERKCLRTVDFVRAFELRKTGACGQAQFAVHALHAPEFVAREFVIDGIVLSARFDH